MRALLFALLVGCGATSSDLRCDVDQLGPCPVVVDDGGRIIARRVCHRSRGVAACGEGFPTCIVGRCDAAGYCSAGP